MFKLALILILVHHSRTQVTANYIPLYLKSGRQATCEYEIRFSPPVDDRITCEKMIFHQHKEFFHGGKIKTFDGVTLYFPRKLPDEVNTSYLQTL